MYQLLACGSNGNYQLGINNDEDQNSLKVTLFDIDGTMSSEVPGKPMKIAGGGNHTMVILDNGEVFSCGSNEFGQCGLPRGESLGVFHKVPGNDWLDISCGWEFSILVKRSGEVYVCGRGLKGWGNSRKGQLGETEDKIMWTPKTLRFGVVCKDFSLGREFTAIQTDTNRVKIFGKSSIKNIPESTVARVAAMWSSVHILSETNVLQSFGNNSHDQLFPNNSSVAVEEYAIGSEHGLVTSDNIVYAWGWSEHGNCGTSNASDKVTFDYLNKLYTGSAKVVLIGAGCATSWVVVEK
ncbi:Regulator of chromosome condensation (RCC1) repeat family protein [Candida albicans]|uniref:Regulator of chromosome condensation (RCC1) repeat family protein n=1 Tax=Candida albicans TaxID=5476 RepID=A0A8H6C672_CANAX|nr:Regulator of chromosome condensation (RCC1) repeat family protein [Candida albicans]